MDAVMVRWPIVFGQDRCLFRDMVMGWGVGFHIYLSVHIRGTITKIKLETVRTTHRSFEVMRFTRRWQYFEYKYSDSITKTFLSVQNTFKQIKTPVL